MAASCDDGDACNGVETCSGGSCQPGTALSCDDGEPCTTGDSCVLGACVAVASALIGIPLGVMRALLNLLDEDGNVVPAPVKNDMQVLHEFTNDLNFLDATQKLRVQPDGKVVFNFGKYMGQPVMDILAKDKNYYFWMLEREFSSQFKQIIKQMMKDLEKGQR